MAEGLNSHVEIILSSYRYQPDGLNRVERVLQIEPHDKLGHVVRVGCSLQGGVAADVLREIRHDIDASEYRLP